MVIRGQLHESKHKLTGGSETSICFFSNPMLFEPTYTQEKLCESSLTKVIVFVLLIFTIGRNETHILERNRVRSE